MFLRWSFVLILVGLLQTSYALPSKKRQLNGLLGGLAAKLGVEAEYDYVIVGGGTGGLAVASRLSENPDLSVAVVEAGGLYQVENPVLGALPAGDVFGCGADPTDTNLVDWNFVTSPQTGANNREVHYARGKALGGSSARNFMIYQRATKETLQQWADEIDDQSYTWDNLLPYFKKTVKFTPPNTQKREANASAEYNAAAFSASGSPLEVSYANYAQTFSTWMEGSLNEIGVKPTQDFNSGSLLGAQYCASTISPVDESRESSQTSFLSGDVTARTNLKVYTFTSAEKIVFDDSKTATGVVVNTVNITGSYNIKAKKEIILSAGAFQSPQLLMLSGVGPADHLKEHGIEVVADRPGVGQNLTDHIFFGPSYRVNVETFTRLAVDPAYQAAQLAGPYTLLQEGPLTNPVADFLGWEKTPSELRSDFSASTSSDLAKFPADWPELEYFSAAGYVGNFASLTKTQPADGYMYATILAALVAPLSRGSVTLSSNKASDLPLINPNWLVSKTDQEVAIAGYKRAREAFASKYMSGVLLSNTTSGIDPSVPAIDKEYFPGKAVESDEQILNTIKDTLMTVWHAAVTCRMGRKDDPNAVVDNEAKVIGVKGLRVVDASSFALLPAGHPQSTIYVLAEKIAAKILGQ